MSGAVPVFALYAFVAQIGTKFLFLVPEFTSDTDSCSQRSVSSSFLVVVLVLGYQSTRG
jgi:hypothetical protein